MSCCYIFISYGHQEISLLEVLKRCKKAIGWQISDLKGISPLVCTHHIYMEEEAKPIRQPQRRLNPHLQEVVRTEVLKLLQAGIIYPISDSPWVSPTQVVPKKSGITVVQNEKGEEIATRLTSGWRVCIDYRKLNAVTRKDHFPLPFIDQVLERVSGHPFLFLGWYSGYFQIEIDVEDQEKTTFTCPFGTYAYRRMPFGLCNAPATFQRCMLSIFSDMVERIMEVFMDDITIYGGTFEECLVNLEAVLKRCIEKDLVLNWEKCHFMVHQGIVLGHIISEKGIEVDKAKVELIAKLPSPTTVKVVRAPNWQLPFEVMCDASDFAIGAVLGQREDGKPYMIYYASKTLNEAQRNYTTTEKELLAVVFALDKFRAYLVGTSAPEHAIPSSSEPSQAPHFVDQPMPHQEPPTGEATEPSFPQHHSTSLGGSLDRGSAVCVLLGNPDGVVLDSNARSVSSRGGVPTPCTRRRSPLRRATFHFLRISHIRNSVRSYMSGSSDRIFHIRSLTPDGRGGRFNFPSQTCPDPLIALTRRASVADNSDSPDSLARQTLAIRRIHFHPQ
ncbi:Retrovirus-related Pol polyprotein from transposon 297 [Vitis vinifera]|uniref:Retrovirus-related Pol polyprotein from transposon 297 n=1 Tax=Vitis vinifera TaxID=29760 RepID=A0A438GAI7_VITVI|nr:Retrovirus-related Pol polyprotein from transposon 297 [Vitis vinifera]